MNKTILTLLCLMLLSSNKAESSIYPHWIKQVAESGYWLGVSPPTTDIDEARKIAIQNAVLYYVNHSGADAVASTVFDEYHTQSASNCNEESKIILNGFSINITNEYHNDYGEYFVACQIYNADNDNSLSVRRTISEENDSGIISYHSEMRIDGDFYGYVYEYSYSPAEISENLQSINLNSSFERRRNYKYPSLTLTPNDNLENGYCIDLKNSLGYSQIFFIATSPITSDYLTSRSSFYSDTNVEDYESQFSVFGAGRLKGNEIYFNKIENNQLGIRAEAKTEEAGYLEIPLLPYDTRNRPFLIDLQLGFYSSFAGGVSMFSCTVSSYGSSFSSNAISDNELDYYVDWGLSNIKKQGHKNLFEITSKIWMKHR